MISWEFNSMSLFFFNDTAATEIYTLSLHDALPIRIVPALAGGAVVVIAARFAVLFGTGRFGRILAALLTACARLVLALSHLGITESPDLLAWAVVLLCVTTALLRD